MKITGRCERERRQRLKRVSTKVVIDIVTGVVLHRESYLYSGPWALLTHDEFAPDVSHFRFYEDGTESGSSPVADEDTNVTGRNVDSDSQIHLRLMVDELGDGDIGGASTDDYDLQFRMNGGGSWVVPTGATTLVQIDTASSLTDAGATTNRATNGLTDGAGSFIAGEQCEANAEVTDFEHTANNFTEHVWALLLISADLSDTDFIEFRLRLNAGNPGMGNTQVPRITVTKTAAGPGDDEIAMAAQPQGQQEPVHEPNEVVGYD